MISSMTRVVDYSCAGSRPAPQSGPWRWAAQRPDEADGHHQLTAPGGSTDRCRGWTRKSGTSLNSLSRLLVEATAVCAAVFWRDLAERAAKTFCQTLVVVLGAGRAGLMSASWVLSLSLGAAAAALSLLTSVGSRLAPIRSSSSCVSEPVDETSLGRELRRSGRVGLRTQPARPDRLPVQNFHRWPRGRRSAKCGKWFDWDLFPPNPRRLLEHKCGGGPRH